MPATLHPRPTRKRFPQIASKWNDPHYAKSGLISLVLHALVILVFGIAIVAPPEYGLEIGQAGVDVDLVAAPPAEAQIAQEELPPVPEEIPVPEDSPPEMTVPTPEIPQPSPQKQKPVEKPKAAATKSGFTGDGSSPVPGKDKTTMRSSSGADVAAKPDYMRNPPPKYPADALRNKVEGLVLLRVGVNAEGRVESLWITKGSGNDSLDKAAEKAVRSWRFHPARAGAFAMACEVEVPIEFMIPGK